MQDYHISVLKDEVLEYLKVKPGKKFIDATLGGGGHSLAIRDQGGDVLGIDQDQDAIDFVMAKSPRKGDPNDKEQKAKGLLEIVKGNFRDIDQIGRDKGFENVAGVVFDLGVSSYQVDSANRGFSFQKFGPLDMRMDRTLSVTARDLVNGLTKQELADLFFRLGEEYQARKIAQAIVSEREKKPIETTSDLEKIVRHTIGGRFSGGNRQSSIHPATKVFQALRIVINDELHNLEDALPKAVELLEQNGRLVVISFHSLEDRIVKQAFKTYEDEGRGTIVTKKPVTAGESEITNNVRARSAKLRVFEKSV